MELQEVFDNIELMLAEAGYKIFVPSRRYCRLKPALLAALPGPSKESAYLVKAHKGRILVGWLQPGRENQHINKKLREDFGRMVKLRPRLMYPFRIERWGELDKLVTPSQRREFRIQIHGTRLGSRQQ